MSNINVLKSNYDIILQEASKKGFNYTGDNLLSYVQWKSKGYMITRGQKAFIMIHLWNVGENRRKVLTGLFTSDQVQKSRYNQFSMV